MAQEGKPRRQKCKGGEKSIVFGCVYVCTNLKTEHNVAAPSLQKHKENPKNHEIFEREAISEQNYTFIA